MFKAIFANYFNTFTIIFSKHYFEYFLLILEIINRRQISKHSFQNQIIDFGL